MKWIFFMLMLFSQFNLSAQKCCDIKLDKIGTIKQIGLEYQRLRKVKYEDCCDKNGSGLMLILDMLHDSLTIGVSKKKIIDIMGQPDKYATKNHPVEYHFDQLNQNESVLIYYWRGMHDFLYFKIKDNKLIEKDWYYAFE